MAGAGDLLYIGIRIRLLTLTCLPAHTVQKLTAEATFITGLGDASMPKPRVWTEDKLDSIRKLTEQGYSNQELAEHFGVTESTMSSARMRWNMPHISLRRQWRGQLRQRVGSMLHSGASRKEVAERIGVSVAALHAAIDRFGLAQHSYERVHIQDVMKIKELHGRGLTNGQIAVRLGEGWKPERVRNIRRYYSQRAAKGLGPWAG